MFELRRTPKNRKEIWEFAPILRHVSYPAALSIDSGPRGEHSHHQPPRTMSQTEMTTTPTRVNGVDLETLGETIEAIQADPGLGKSRFRARNRWIDGNQNRTTISDFYAAREEMNHAQSFELRADEPPILAGDDEAPNPVEHLLNALAGCVTTSMVAHAAVRGIHIEALESELEGDIDLNGFLGLDPKVPKGYTDIRVKFRVKTDPENVEKVRSLAKFSPVYNTLMNGANVEIDVEPA